MIMMTTGLFGAVCGIIGSWLFLERKSLFIDTIAHATFPGITLIFFITYNKNFHILMVGALCSSLFAAYLIKKLTLTTTLKKDTILGIILAACFSLGTIILSKIQQLNVINSGLLTKYFLGNPATMLEQDCIIITIISVIALTMFIFYKNKYNAILFDPILSNTLKLNIPLISSIILGITTLIIIAGMQIVGIILMSSLLINPAAAAYQWSKNFNLMVVIAACFGLIATLSGMYLSSMFYHLPPGPMIVIIATIITCLSLLLSPQGIILEWYHNKQNFKDLDTVQLLSRFLLFNEAKTNPYYAHNIATLTAIGKPITQEQLLKLQKQGYLDNPQFNYWALTEQGVQFLKKHKEVSL
jgi:manganese/zinc/iron transport system permease protein